MAGGNNEDMKVAAKDFGVVGFSGRSAEGRIGMVSHSREYDAKLKNNICTKWSEPLKRYADYANNIWALKTAGKGVRLMQMRFSFGVKVFVDAFAAVLKGV